MGRIFGGKKRKVGKGRFGGGSSSSRVSPDYLMELPRGMSEEDQATFKRNMGSHGGDDVSSLDGDKPQVGVRGKPGKKFLRSAFFVGSGKREDGFFKKIIFMVLFDLFVFSRCGETNQQLSQGALSYGRGCSAGCEDNFDCHEVQASAVAGRAGWCEDTFDDCVHASENSVVAGVAASTGRELDVAVAGARCGENNCNGHLLEFRNSLLAAESGYSLHRLHFLNSLICHPTMHAPSLASGLFGENVGVVGVGRFCHGDTGIARWLGTARVDWSLHDVIHSVSACSNSLIRGHTECHGSSCGQMGSSPNSRVARGPGLCGGTKGQVRQSVEKSLPLLSNCQAGCM